jgi:hypothetical protein
VVESTAMGTHVGEIGSGSDDAVGGLR